MGALADGHVLTVWERAGSVEDEPRLLGRWFDPSDQPLGAEFEMGNPRVLRQTNPIAEVDRGAGVVVSWVERMADGRSRIVVQRFSPPVTAGSLPTT